MPDSIERDVILPVPPARVWTALTQPDQLAAWWGTQATIDLQPGGEVVFIWHDPTGARTTRRAVIEVLEPPNRFVFRWQSSPDPVAMTRVEFTLQAHPDGTRLHVIESGFANLPPEFRGASHERNTRGWQRALSGLTEYLAA